MKPIGTVGGEYVASTITCRSGGLSVIMPAYNTAGQIIESLVRVERILDGVAGDYEVIVVDDGSEDGTRDVVESYLRLRPKVKLISYNENVGKGYALRRGFDMAGGEIVVFLDSDSDIDAACIESYVEALQSCDMVIASKRHPKSDYKAPLMRKILSAAFNIIVKILFGIRYSDTQAGLKAFRKTALAKIMRIGLVKRYAFDVELLALANMLGLRVKEAPVNVHLDARFSLRHIIYMLIDMMGIFYRLRVIGWYRKNLNSKTIEYKPIIRI